MAAQLEKHELMEFRRISAFIYKKALRWRKAVALAKQDKLYKVCLPFSSLASMHCICPKTCICTLAYGHLTGRKDSTDDVLFAAFMVHHGMA